MAGRDRRALPRAGAVVLGEVTTALLDQNAPLTREQTETSLRLAPGRPVAVREHPRRRAVSPEIFLGVDCSLAHGASGLVRGIGSVTARAVLTGGHVVQGSARATVRVDGSGVRHRWGHYTTHPGVIEVIDAASPTDLVDGFLAVESSDSRSLNLGAVGAHVLDRVSADATDPGAQLKTRRTGLRWALRLIGGVAIPNVDLRPGTDGAWWISLSAHPEEIAAVTEFCEDVALNLWLLKALDTVCDRSIRNPAAMRELKPALSYLGHLWLPEAHVKPAFRSMWQQLEDSTGVEREWTILLARVRDRITAGDV